MYGADERDLPVLRLQYDDPGRTLVHIRPSMADVVLNADGAQRAGRWLFNFRHSRDLPRIQCHPLDRATALTSVSIGALTPAFTGVVLGSRRLRFFLYAGLGPTPARDERFVQHRAFMTSVRMGLGVGKRCSRGMRSSILSVP